jgi:hypothetical protein
MAWAFALLLAAFPAGAGSIFHPSAPDPILSGGVPGPCDPRSQGADYVSGTDINGNPVTPANADAKPPVLPKTMLVPLGRHQGQAVISAEQLAGLMDNSGCPKRR